MLDIKALKSVAAATNEVCSEPVEYPFKRTFDFILAALAILISTPLWLVFPIAIKLEDGGPVFYRQSRVGKNGRLFNVLKFRTLLQNADQVVRPWVNPDQQWVTKVGGFLRRTGLDELPQVLNILSGDMSVVGPRPMPVEEFEAFKDKIHGLERRLYVRPGLTGNAQVHGKATRDARAKLHYDLIYIRDQSFWLDLKLITLSLWITFRGRWESREKKV